ncbi:hypothetical protein THASP1DRAFT_28561 [Thamnocephalis sphaerospora]|uniref:Transmembrane 9 superfamily member n=1 Tax=Thamnocephalis sphaerospora TaxID=78915 RepID=A0A4P9XTX6_9FUNG|nr:hypothetical protein THASP1DRAFT_28561 [Thamnocephalis sphaerospora]|eukprot:RKP09647.1 hypothetical protein THASP1DRAFT_28561 [Thamnocephalis sphaerospora]
MLAVCSLTATLLLLLLSAGGVRQTDAFYIAGNAPQHYLLDDTVPVYWNKVYPAGERLNLPYPYADLPFVCHPAQWELPYMNLGRSMAGDQLVRSDIQIEMGRNETCKVLCRRQVTPDAVELALSLIRDQYMVEWFIDELPVSRPWVNMYDRNKQYGDGFPLGYYDPLMDSVFIYNHFILQILYEKSQTGSGQRLIVGVEIYPKSVENHGLMCPHDASIPGIHQQGLSADISGITYTYSVMWQEETSVSWGKRWDSYLSFNGDTFIHWLSIGNASVILALIALTVAAIAVRALSIPIPFRNSDDTSDQDDMSGWKQLHGDVFRAPENERLLAILVGSGLQVLCTIAGVLLLAALGILNPSFPGGLVSVGIFLYVFAGLLSGYTSARIYRTFGQEEWRRNAIQTAVLVPGGLYLLLVLLNFFNWAKGSATSISFGVFITLLTLWVCLMGPMVVAGAYVGERRPAFSHPVHTSAVRRTIPKPVWYMRSLPSVLLAGIIPFGTIFLQEYLLLQYMWGDRFYYFYGFLGASFLLLATVSVLVTLAMTYFQLCSEDYRWWWRSFFVGGSASIYIFAYTLLHCCIRLGISSPVSGFLYLVHALVASVVLGVALGSISFMVTYYAMRKVFKIVKVN